MRQLFVRIALLAIALSAGYFYGRSATPESARAAPMSAASAAPRDVAPPVARDEPRVLPARGKPNVAAPNARPPLPPAGAPLAQTFDELRARADNGDAAAASRLFNDLERCRVVQTMARYAPEMIADRLDHGRKPTTPEELAQQEQFLGHAQQTLDLIQQNQTLCADVDASQLNAIVPVMLEAAQGGDRRARDCYVGMDYMNMPGLLDHPEWLTQYKENAMAFAQSAYEQGDWVAVGLLQHAYAGLFESSLLGQLIGADPNQAYRYLKLQRLGANGDFIGKLDEQLAQAEKPLTKEQIAEADLWAHQAYASYFHESSSNELSNGVNICGSLED